MLQTENPQQPGQITDQAPRVERIDLTVKENWKLENADRIAPGLGFENNADFRTWLEGFIPLYVIDSLFTHTLANVAINDARSKGLARRQ
jgi:hypothetical protein